MRLQFNDNRFHRAYTAVPKVANIDVPLFGDGNNQDSEALSRAAMPLKDSPATLAETERALWLSSKGFSITFRMTLDLRCLQ